MNQFVRRPARRVDGARRPARCGTGCAGAPADRYRPGARRGPRARGSRTGSRRTPCRWPRAGAVPAAAPAAAAPLPHRHLRRHRRPPRRASARTPRPRRTSCTRRSATTAWRDGGNVDGAPRCRWPGRPRSRRPGPAAGQTAYVFTAVGTPGPADVQKLPLNVTWVNLTTGKSGSATLKPRPDINPRGADDVDRDRRHRLGQHHVDDLRAGHHQGQAVPVHAHHRLDGGALSPEPLTRRRAQRVSRRAAYGVHVRPMLR